MPGRRLVNVLDDGDQFAIRWALLMPDGGLVRGRGQDAPGGMKLSTIALDATAAMFCHPAGRPLVVAGAADILWTVQGIVGGKRQQRALGVSVPEGSRVWIMDNGFMGLARSIEDLAAAEWSLLHALQEVEA